MYIITVVLPLSDGVIIAFSAFNIWLIAFNTYACLLCNTFVKLGVLMICFNFLVARNRYVFCMLVSSRRKARSVSAMRLFICGGWFFDAVFHSIFN